MAAKKSSKKQVFSVTKAVKANARQRVGPPPASRVLPAERPATGRKQKHKPKWDALLHED
ncbi:MAG TPA: hypothetical protein VMU62_00960 [Acidobacteriaceae bacterium]|nr:hypothetical protein [Acidobacteriaceae bacterium]